MKKLFKKIVQYYLQFLVKIVLKRHRPELIIISGSNYKHTLKLVLFNVLKKKYKVRIGPKKYNAELGVPLTILGFQADSSSIKVWLPLLGKAAFYAFFSFSFPEKLILEMAIDKPGDMNNFLSFLTPSVVILTNITTEYLDNFGSLDREAREYKKLVKKIPSQGKVFLNSDDPRIRTLKTFCDAKVYCYGTKEGSDLRAANFQENKDGTITFDIYWRTEWLKKETVPYGKKNVYAKLIEIAASKFLF